MRNGDSQTPPRMLGVDSMGSPSICLKQGLQGGFPGWELPEWFWGSAVQTRHDQTLCLPVGAEPLRRPFCAEPALLSCALLALLCCSGSPVLFWMSCAVLCHAVPALLCCAGCPVLWCARGCWDLLQGCWAHFWLLSKSLSGWTPDYFNLDHLLLIC